MGCSALWNDQMLRPGPRSLARGQADAARGNGNRQVRPRIHLLLSLCFSYAHFVDLFLALLFCLCCGSCSIFASANIPASVSLPMCLLFHLSLLQQVYFFPTVSFTYSDSIVFKALSDECCFLSCLFNFNILFLFLNHHWASFPQSWPKFWILIKKWLFFIM